VAMHILLFCGHRVRGCGSAKAAGPKWPAPSTTAEDGGESLEPKPTATYAAALEKSAEAEKKPEAKDIEDKPAATTTDDKPATTPSTEDKPATTDDVMMTEEIVIEIEE
jgi:hypothetical protein